MFDYNKDHYHSIDYTCEKEERRYMRTHTPIPPGMVIRNGGIEPAFPGHSTLGQDLNAKRDTLMRIANALRESDLEKLLDVTSEDSARQVVPVEYNPKE